MSERAAVRDPAVLAFLIADIRGYTGYTRAHGDEAAARLAATFAEIAQEGVEAYGGSLIETRGDEILATFSSPRQAVRCAIELQAVLSAESRLHVDLPLNVGVGIDVGEAVPVATGYRGDALNFAARLCASAAAGEILFSDQVRRLVGEMEGVQAEVLDGLTLKGIAGPVQAARITAANSEPLTSPTHVLAPAIATTLPVELDPVTPLFGRDVEARHLRWLWRQARTGRGASVLLTGPTGIGKTRLAAEPALLAQRDGATSTYTSGFSGALAKSINRAGVEDAPAVIVIDDLESATDEDVGAARAAIKSAGARPLLIVAIAADDGRPTTAATIRSLAQVEDTLRLGPLAKDAVAAIVATYSTDAAGPAPVEAIEQASAGRPAVVHELAADWARLDASQRLGVAVARTVDGRRDLRELESEVASNVIDLQLAQTRRYFSGRSRGLDPDQCPFMGLLVFDVDDADRFFGRERLVAEMVGRLAGANLLAIVGPSGSGKSSAVRAGLIPAVASGGLPGADRWTRIVMRPGAHPLRELDRVVYASLSAELRGRLSADPETADDPLAVAARLLPTESRPFVVVDQFEELFTATEDQTERDAFVSVLEQAAERGYATVVVALRADFYGHFARYPGLAKLLAEATVLVGPMSAAEYARAIEGPARRAGLTMDQPLVDALVLEVVDQPGALPLLSTALVELWERRDGRAIRLSAYAATGGIRGAVARLAETAYERLDTDEQQIARGLFLRLSAGEGDTVVRRRVPLAELGATDDGSRVGEVIRKLADARLLTIGEGTVEVAHEALLREWPRLADWIEEDRAGRLMREHLTTAARDWQAGGRDPGELYRGTRLASANDWTAAHALELTEAERSFLAESRDAAAKDVDRQRRANRRLRVLLGAAVALLLLAAGAGALALWQRGAAEQAATVADAQRLGAEALTRDDLDVSLLLARQGVALDNDSATRSNLLSAIVRSPAAIGAWRPVSGRPLGVSVNADGTRLLIFNNSQEVELVDATTGQPLRDVGSGFGGWFTPDGSIAVYQPVGNGVQVVVSSLTDGTTLRTIDIPQGQNFTVSPDVSNIAQVDNNRLGITVMDSATQAPIRHLTVPNTTMLDVWEYDGNALVAVAHAGLVSTDSEIQQAFDGPVELIYFPPGSTTPTATIPAAAGDSGTWALDPATTEIAVPQLDGTIAVFDLPAGTRRDFALRHNGLQGISFSPDGKTLVTAGDDKLMQVWDASSGQLRETLAGHAGRVFAPALSDAGGHLTAWSVGLDGQLIEWDLTGDRRIDRPYSVGGTPSPRGDLINGLAVSPDGRWFVLPNSDGHVDVFDAHSLTKIVQLDPIPSGPANSVAFSPDSRTLAVGGKGAPLIQRFDTTTWTPVGDALTGPPATVPVTDPNADPTAPPDLNAVNGLAWSADGRLLAAGTQDGGVYVWDAATAAAPTVYSPGGPVVRVAFSPDMKQLAATYTEKDGGKATVWTLADGKQQYQVSVDDAYGAPLAAMFTHDGKMLITAGGIGVVRFWDAATGAANGRSVLANSGWVDSLALTPDDSVLMTAGTDGTVRMIDTAGRHQLGSPLPGGDSDSFAALGPDGRVFVIYEPDGHGYVWDISLPSLVADACSVAGRPLTQVEWDQYVPGRPYAPACDAASSRTPGTSSASSTP